jgi:hypothetical protein
LTATLSVAGYGCSSSSGGRRGTGGAAGATANAGSSNNGGSSNTGGGANNGGSTNNGGTSGGSMGSAVNQVKKPMASMDTGAPGGVAAMTDATQAGGGGLVTNTAQAGDEGDSVWTEMEDIDGDGVLDEYQVLVDDETGDKYVWYDTVIEAFCTDGSDANSTVILVYIAADDAWTMMWDSDCPEDEGLVYACGLDAEGNAVADSCGVCTVDAEGVLQCGDPGTTGDGDVVGDGDVSGDGDIGGDGDVQPPIVENPYACQCAFDCDGFQDVTDVGAYCAESLEGAQVAVQADCEGLFLPDECATLTCECACEDSTEFTCEATAF